MWLCAQREAGTNSSRVLPRALAETLTVWLTCHTWRRGFCVKLPLTACPDPVLIHRHPKGTAALESKPQNLTSAIYPLVPIRVDYTTFQRLFAPRQERVTVGGLKSATQIESQLEASSHTAMERTATTASRML